MKKLVKLFGIVAIVMCIISSIILVNYMTMAELKIEQVNEEDNVIVINNQGQTWVYEY